MKEINLETEQKKSKKPLLAAINQFILTIIMVLLFLSIAFIGIILLFKTGDFYIQIINIFKSIPYFKYLTVTYWDVIGIKLIFLSLLFLAFAIFNLVDGIFLIKRRKWSISLGMNLCIIYILLSLGCGTDFLINAFTQSNEIRIYEISRFASSLLLLFTSVLGLILIGLSRGELK